MPWVGISDRSAYLSRFAEIENNLALGNGVFDSGQALRFRLVGAIPLIAFLPSSKVARALARR